MALERVQLAQCSTLELSMITGDSCKPVRTSELTTRDFQTLKDLSKGCADWIGNCLQKTLVLPAAERLTTAEDLKGQRLLLNGSELRAGPRQTISSEAFSAGYAKTGRELW